MNNLFDWVSPGLGDLFFSLLPHDPFLDHHLVKQFEELHRENLNIYRRFCSLCFKAAYKRDYYGARTIIEHMRWETEIGSKDPEDFKINDHSITFYSRMFMLEFPKHHGFFATRNAVAGKLGFKRMKEYISWARNEGVYW